MADDLRCPHCKTIVDMTDIDIYPRHTSFYGEDGPREHTCVRCDASIYLDERVSRYWTVGRTPEEACDG